MYFAAQAMAAEMSTGLLVMQEVQRVKPIKISMLVYRMECDFIKKATGRIFFESKDGAKVKHCMESIVKSKEGQILDLYATGKNEHGEIVSTYKFTWTLKQK